MFRGGMISLRRGWIAVWRMSKLALVGLDPLWRWLPSLRTAMKGDRMPAMSGPKVLEFQGFRLDRFQRVVTGPDGAPVRLQPRVFDTLLALVERAGEVVSKEALMTAIWPDVTVAENNLNQAISALRKALGEETGKRLIVTVPGRGYQFTSEVVAPHAKAMETVSESTDGAAEPAAAGLSWRAWTLIALGIAGLVLTGWMTLSPGNQRVALEPSVAVLPFANLTGNPDKDYIARGVAVEIIDRLSQLEGLKVISRNSSFTFGADADPRQPSGPSSIVEVRE